MSNLNSWSVIIGRFQPFHKGHGYLVKQALSKTDNLIIIIGSSFSSRTLRNSFSFYERKQMILEALNDSDFNEIKNIKNKVHFFPVRDYLYDKGDVLWQEDILKGVDNILKNQAQNILLTGYEKDQTSYYLNYFIERHNWKYLGCNYYKKINGTEIRLSYLSENKTWNDIYQNQCYQSSVKWLNKFRETQDFIDLTSEYKSMIDYKKLWSGSPFPPIFVTCDALVLYRNKILLITRKDFPGKGLLALPGGFLESSEKIIDGIIRELYEETCLEINKKSLLNSLLYTHAFDDPKRSSRGRIITHVGLFKLNENITQPKVIGSDDAASASWVDINYFQDNPEKIFSDHYQIVNFFLQNQIKED